MTKLTDVKSVANAALNAVKLTFLHGAMLSIWLIWLENWLFPMKF